MCTIFFLSPPVTSLIPQLFLIPNFLSLLFILSLITLIAFRIEEIQGSRESNGALHIATRGLQGAIHHQLGLPLLPRAVLQAQLGGIRLRSSAGKLVYVLKS